GLGESHGKLLPNFVGARVNPRLFLPDVAIVSSVSRPVDCVSRDRVNGFNAAAKKPGARRAGPKLLDLRGLGPAFGGPGARALARAGDPHAGPVGRRQLALTVGALAAARDLDDHGAVFADLATHRKRGIARIADRAVVDLDGIAVGAVAAAFMRDDQHA